MHTFFINTSKKNLEGYDVLFDIHYENRALVSLTCPMSDWYDPEKGYEACVAQMSDLIDGYVELNNAFNLILYIDLAEDKTYSAIQKTDFGDQERDACLQAMGPLFTHAIYGSIVGTLEASGRKPQTVLIMFGEDKKYADYHAARAKATPEQIKGMLFRFLGLPSCDKLAALIAEADKAPGTPAEKQANFTRQVLSACTEELIPGLRKSYKEDLDLWCEEMLHAAQVERPCDELFERIMGTKRTEEERKRVETVFCPYDCFASSVNKSALAVSRLNIALYLLRCVEEGSVYQDGALPSTHGREVFPFRVYTAEEVAPLFRQKAAAYERKAENIETMAQTYWELGLARQLSEFHHSQFGLDEYGERKTDLVVVDAAEESAGKGKDDKSGEPEAVAVVGKDKQVVAVTKTSRVLLKEEYEPFVFPSDSNRAKMLHRNTSPEEYIEQAKQIRSEHLDFLNKLKLHITKVLSNYAGKSKENKAALLRMGGARYAAGKKESKPLSAVETVSEKAYDTILNEFLEFCASRSVAVTDIEEQCDWFVTRIHQIRESLNRIKYVALGVFFALIALYIPFLVIQYEQIVESVLTVFMALASLAVPFVLLYTVFGIVAAAQRKKYRQAWADFEAKADAARLENETAARKYDQLLSTVIPALRWVYEYKLDVAYCADCCQVADAKLEHHRRKLRERAEGIRNLLSDLETSRFGGWEAPAGKDNPNDIDYNVPFCSGQKNRKYYSVVDKQFFAPANS